MLLGYLWLLLALVSLACQIPISVSVSLCQGFFQCKLLISMVSTSESDPPSFWVENANYTLMRLRALSIPGQDESIACFLLRLSQWCFYLQLHAYLPCYNIQLLSLCCTDVQGQCCCQMGTNTPLQKKKKKMQHSINLETKYRHAQNTVRKQYIKHSPDVSEIPFSDHKKGQILICSTICSKNKKVLEILAKITN